jgi:8-oxo-dGTP diphosphatase
MTTGKTIVEMHPIGAIKDDLLSYAVICAEMNSKLICVKHHARSSWEIPGGRRETTESIRETAVRELYEETGAVNFIMTEICEYSVTINEKTSFGRLYKAVIQELQPLPASEISELDLFETLPDLLTYPDIQPLLLQVAWPEFEKPSVE